MIMTPRQQCLSKNPLLAWSLVLALGWLVPLRAADSLEQDFRQPPSDAKNWVYWVWLRTPTTPAAITRDLEEMKAKGIDGLILYDCGAGNGRFPDKKMVASKKAFIVAPTDEYKGATTDPLPLMRTWSPEWRKLVRHVALESKRVGLKFSLAAGMSGFTAPGLDPRYTDQELKWTSQVVTGPAKFEGVLPLPEKSKASNPDGSPMFWDVRVVALPLDPKKPVQLGDIQDLSSKMDRSGKLSWEVPIGKWRILRFIQRPINKVEHWGAHLGTYCNTLSAEGIEQDWALTMGPLLKEMTAEERSGLIAVEDDSYEGGHGNWTRIFPGEFQKRRAYDLMPYLPVLAGITVGDATTTARVQRDYQQTITGLAMDNYFGRLQQLCHENGMAFYCEGNWPSYWKNGYQETVKKVDLNMAEFWMPSADCPVLERRFLSRECATANHLFGKKITMSEAFTSSGPLWEETPFSMKACVDEAYCDGVNRILISSYSHSPLLDAKPGYAFYAGTLINRNITWWDEAPVFFSYMERCHAMLQNGRFTADALWLAGDGITESWNRKLNPTVIRELGEGYDYDRINTDNLTELAEVKQGCIVTPSGMTYRILIMPPSKGMTLAALEKIARLAESGATIVGPRPGTLVGLPLYAGDEKQYNQLLTKLWGDASLTTSDIKVGQGRVISGKTPAQVLCEMGVGPDFEYTGLSDQGEVGWIHRQSADADWYFVASRWFSPERLTCKFRITGKQPELWDPVTGEIRDATAFRQENGQTVVPLEFDPCGSVFVVFRKPIAPTAAGTTASNYPTLSPLATLGGPWSVSFDHKWGGPADPVIFDSLVDWTERPEEGIKYYSGSAVYTKTFDVPGSLPAGKRLVLDLGEVREVASVKLNGKDMGVIWMHPARMDITDAVRPKGNKLEIKVVNLWPNRLIGDAFLPPDKQFTKTNMHRFTRNSHLFPSGLLGPVTLQFGGMHNERHNY